MCMSSHFSLHLLPGPDCLKTKMSELRLYCDLLVQQVQTIKSQHSDDQETPPTSEVSILIFIIELIGSGGNPVGDTFLSSKLIIQLKVKKKKMKLLVCIISMSQKTDSKSFILSYLLSTGHCAIMKCVLLYCCISCLFFPSFCSGTCAGVSSQCHVCNVHQDTGGVYEPGQSESDP